MAAEACRLGLDAVERDDQDIDTMITPIEDTSFKTVEIQSLPFLKLYKNCKKDYAALPEREKILFNSMIYYQRRANGKSEQQAQIETSEITGCISDEIEAMLQDRDRIQSWNMDLQSHPLHTHLKDIAQATAQIPQPSQVLKQIDSKTIESVGQMHRRNWLLGDRVELRQLAEQWMALQASTRQPGTDGRYFKITEFQCVQFWKFAYIQSMGQ